MKKLALIFGLSLLLVGCSDNKVVKENKEEVKIVKVDKETKEKAEKFAKDFTDNTSGNMEMKFNDKNNSFDIKYVNEDLNKVVETLSNSLEKVETFNALTILARQAQENTDVFDKFNNEFSVNLENPNNKDLPLYSITKEKITYPASDEAFNGELPKELSKNMDGIIKTVNFSFNPKGNAEYIQKEDNIIVNFNMTDEELNYSNSQNSMKETLKNGLQISYDTIESVYSEKYDIILKNNDKEFMRIENGSIK